MTTRRKKLLAVIAGIFVLFAIIFVVLFLVARHATQDEWSEKLQPRTPAEIRGLVDAMTRFTSEPPNFLPLSALDDEVCAAAVANAVNFILGEERLQSAPAWLFSQVNAEVLTERFNRSADFEIDDDRIIETFDRGFRLSEMLSPGGLYILGYHYRETQADDKIIAAGADLNSHLMLLLGQNDDRWYGYHLIHYPGNELQNPVLVEPVDETPNLLDLVYIWQVDGVEIPEEGNDLFLANTSPPYSVVRPWLNNGPQFLEYYLDTVSVWLLNKFNGSHQFPMIINLQDQELVEIPINGGVFHGRIMGFYNSVPVYFNGEQSYRGQYGREFQCVEYANRFLVSQGHRNLTQTGHADSYFWEAESKGLQAFPNGGSVGPQINDLLVFDQGNQDGIPGHVAVLYSVTDDYVCFVQQNVGTRWRDCLPIRQAGGWQMTLPTDRVNLYPPIAGWSRVQ